MLNIALLKSVAVFGHKGMNGNVLLYTDLCVCCSDTPCSLGSVLFPPVCYMSFGNHLQV